MKKSKIEGIVIHSIFILFALACILPLVMIISISLSRDVDFAKTGYTLIPAHFDLSGYIYVLNKPNQILNAYKISLTVSIAGTLLSLLFTSGIAYAISRPDFKFRKQLSFFVYFTMLFSGGLVPTYILIVNYLNMKNTLFALILPYLIVPWYVLLLRTFMQKIPGEILESCMVDGADEFRIFFQFILPLSLPSLATIGLFTMLQYWNDWWLGLLYIEKEGLVPLQLLLYKIMANIEYLTTANSMPSNFKGDVFLPAESARMAMALLAAGPMLLVFPFFQKYFVSGLTVGAVKG